MPEYYNCANCGFTHTKEDGCNPDTIEYNQFAEEIAKIIYDGRRSFNKQEGVVYDWECLRIANKIAILAEKKTESEKTEKWKNMTKGIKFDNFMLYVQMR